MTDREERQHVIEVLKSWDGYFIGYTSDEVQEALRYAIASIETDLRYDLLYEETSEQADKSTTKNDLAVDAISRQFMYELGATCIATRNENGKLIALGAISELPSVTLQLSSELDKNSKKLEKGCESDCISRAEVLKLMQDNWHTHNGDWAMQESMDDIRALPTVTPIIPKGHWRKTPKAVMGEGYMWYCDKCNHEVYQDSSRSYPSENYCPNCGSDNREVEE